jgi:GNAT superfamily N-acetyltransferase
LPDVPVAPVAGDFVALAPVADCPDARVFLTDASGVAVAHAALWWRATPPHDGARLGCIGGFASPDGTSARRLLDGAVAVLAAAGCRNVVGPMNGNTWRRHRFVVESDGRGPFLLEPRNPPEQPLWWQDAGFSVLSRYSSSVIVLDEDKPTIPAGLAERLHRSGVVVRDLLPEKYDDELRAIHAVSVKSFASNFLYTPLDLDDFLDAYRKVRDKVEPGLVRLAEKDGVPCGFVFAIRDWEALARGEEPAVIVKTLAVDPAARCAGLGSLLVEQVHGRARAMGFHEAIHALQFQDNSSLKITGRHHGRVFRRYALFERKP